MKIRKYPYKKLNEYMYRFFSIGPRGKFEMRVFFTALRENLFNLGFGIWNPESRMLDDLILLRNNDMDVILATVADVTFNFLSSDAGVWIIATGSSPARTRKYQMGIARYKEEMLPHYRVLGLVCERNQDGNIIGDFPEWSGEWHKFEKGANYDAFLISQVQ